MVASFHCCPLDIEKKLNTKGREVDTVYHRILSMYRVGSDAIPKKDLTWDYSWRSSGNRSKYQSPYGQEAECGHSKGAQSESPLNRIMSPSMGMYLCQVRRRNLRPIKECPVPDIRRKEVSRCPVCSPWS